MKLNDNCDQVDFRAEIDQTLTYGENLANLEANHPELNWSDQIMGPKTYEKAQLWEAESLVDEFSYGILKKSKIKSLQRAVKRSDRLKRKLAICVARPIRGPSKPGHCRVKTVNVEGHMRCPPRK